MRNHKIAKIFNDIARFLEIDGVAFKPYAYQRAAMSLEGLKEDVADIYRKGGKAALQEIPGIGKGIAGHIEEYLKKGTIADLENFKKRLPVDMEGLLRVEGLGPKKVKVLYEKLGIKNIKDLEKAVKTHKIAPLFGFGEKTEQNIVQGLEFLKKGKGRSFLGEILPIARQVLWQLEKLPEVQKASLAGSLRRMRETIGDVDFLVVSKNPKKTMDFFVNLPGVEKVWGKGGTKASVHMINGFDMDLRVIRARSYGSALQYFTGSKDHNIITRKIAIEKGLKLSEYGLFRGKVMIANSTEEQVYKALGMQWIPPEMRENSGEIEVALQGKLPSLVELGDIRGDLHVHSNWEEPKGAKSSLEDLAEKAMGMGYEYLGISDHTKDLNIERGLSEKELLEENKYIKKLNTKFSAEGKKFSLLHGCEANIRKDGSIDIDDEVLSQLDYVVASVHSHTKMDVKEMSARLERAMRNPHVDILGHPTGRIEGNREEYAHNFDHILRVAKETHTILEINSSSRLDLQDIYIRRAKNEGVKMIINTDTHNISQLNLMEFGISQARRGWAEKKDVINTLPIEKLLDIIK